MTTLNSDGQIEDTYDIDSESGNLLYAKLQNSSQPPSIVTFLIKKHIVKNENSARALLLIVSITMFAVSLYFIIKSFNGPVFIDTINKNTR